MLCFANLWAPLFLSSSQLFHFATMSPTSSTDAHLTAMGAVMKSMPSKVRSRLTIRLSELAEKRQAKLDERRAIASTPKPLEQAGAGSGGERGRGFVGTIPSVLTSLSFPQCFLHPRPQARLRPLPTCHLGPLRTPTSRSGS